MRAMQKIRISAAADLVQKPKNPTPRRCNLPESLRTVLRLQMEWDEHRGGRDPVGCSPSRSSDPSGGIRDSNETIPSFRTKTGAAQTRGELASACIAQRHYARQLIPRHPTFTDTNRTGEERTMIDDFRPLGQ